jgi:hypothetical protein
LVLKIRYTGKRWYDFFSLHLLHHLQMWIRPVGRWRALRVVLLNYSLP